MMELFRMAMNEAMKLERENFLNAGAYERTEGRQGYANGFKPKNYNMRSGSPLENFLYKPHESRLAWREADRER